MSFKNKTLRFILGDQHNLNHSWFKLVDENILYVMMEVRQETDYVMHLNYKSKYSTTKTNQFLRFGIGLLKIYFVII